MRRIRRWWLKGMVGEDDDWMGKKTLVIHWQWGVWSWHSYTNVPQSFKALTVLPLMAYHVLPRSGQMGSCILLYRISAGIAPSHRLPGRARPLLSPAPRRGSRQRSSSPSPPARGIPFLRFSVGIVIPRWWSNGDRLWASALPCWQGYPLELLTHLCDRSANVW